MGQKQDCCKASTDQFDFLEMHVYRPQKGVNFMDGQTKSPV